MPTPTPLSAPLLRFSCPLSLGDTPTTMPTYAIAPLPALPLRFPPCLLRTCSEYNEKYVYTSTSTCAATSLFVPTRAY